MSALIIVGLYDVMMWRGETNVGQFGHRHFGRMYIGWLIPFPQD